MSCQPCLMQWLDRTRQGFYMYSIEDGAKYINVDSKPSNTSNCTLMLIKSQNSRKDGRECQSSPSTRLLSVLASRIPSLIPLTSPSAVYATTLVTRCPTLAPPWL